MANSLDLGVLKQRIQEQFTKFQTALTSHIRGTAGVRHTTDQIDLASAINGISGNTLHEALGSVSVAGVGVFSSVSALRAFTGVAGQKVTLLGYNTPNDGGGGEFVWDTTIASDDDGTILNSAGYSASSAGWRRLYTGLLDVRWFGADSTGNTDSSTAWSRTQAAAISNKKGAWVPGGTYLINDHVLATDANWTLDRRALLKCTNNTHSIWVISGNVNRVRIDGGTYSRCKYVVEGASSGAINDSKFRDFYIVGYTPGEPCLAGFYLPRGAGIEISGINIDGGSVAASNITDGMVLGANSGDGAAQFFNANVIENCRIVQVGGDGIRLPNAAVAKNAVKISGCWFEWIGQSAVDCGGGCRNVNITHNYFANTGQVDSSQPVINAQRTLGPLISGLHIQNNFFGTTLATRLLKTAQAQISFRNNGCLLYHAGQLIAEWGNSSHYTVEDNYLAFLGTSTPSSYQDVFSTTGTSASGVVRIPSGNYGIVGNDSEPREVIAQGPLLTRRNSAPSLGNGEGTIWRSAESGSLDDLLYTYRNDSGVLYQTTIVDASLLSPYVWVPTEIGALRGWWRNTADDFVLSGSDIINWKDASGYGNNGLPSGNAPQYVANDGAGHIAASFTAASTQALAANTAATYFDGSGDGLEDQPFFMFAALQLSDTAAVYTLLGFGSSADVIPQRILRTSGTNFQARLRDDANTAKNPNGAGANTSLNYIVATSDGTLLDIWLNGIKIVSGGDLNVGIIGANALLDRCYIGARTNTTDGKTEYMNGNILQLGFGIAALSADEITSLNTYLASVVV